MFRSQVLLKVDQAINYINSGDIALFEGSGPVSKIIRTFSGGGSFSHVGLLSWTGTSIECLEYREFKGARAVNLKREVEKKPGKIAVFSCTDEISRWLYDKTEKRLKEKRLILDRIGVVNCMRELLGSDYNYSSIWNIAKRNIPGLRLFYSMNADDSISDGSKFICSSSLAHCFTKVNFDLFPYKADNLVTPNDYAENPLLSYLFHLIP